MKFSSLTGTLLLICLTSLAHAGAETGSVLSAPKITISKILPGQEAGLIFVAPTPEGPSSEPTGPEIVDDQGRPVWFSPVTNGQVPTDFRVQSYEGRPVLTWAQQKGFPELAHGKSVDYIVDSNYHVVAQVHAGNGLDANGHEFFLTPENTALITIYQAVRHDFSSVGISTKGWVIDGIVQEIDVATGEVIFEWHSLDHVPLGESYYLPPPPTPSREKAWDYFHLNAVSLDDYGNLLISSRYTATVYDVNRRTGRVIWRLGGKNSDFVLEPGARFWYQHDPIADGGLIRIFDNESDGTQTMLPYSRVIWLDADPVAKTGRLVRSLRQPQNLSVTSEGNSQELENGNTFVGWGILGRFSEFDPDGNLIFDASVPSAYGTYRAYRFAWRGNPDTKPTAFAQRQSNGKTLVHAVWNGATEVARWDVLDASELDDPDQRLESLQSIQLGASTKKGGKRVASAPWNGLDTAICVNESLKSVVVVAMDSFGHEIGRSRPARSSQMSLR